MNKAIFTGILFLMSWGVFAQNAILKGKVVTSDGKPAEFVSVSLKGTNKGTVADIEGNYQINNLKSGTYNILVSFVGLKSETKKVTIKANETQSLDFTLEANATQLQEVLVSSNPSKYVTDYPSISLRLKTPLLEIPQNIQVVTSQALKDQQIFDMSEGVTRNVSGAARSEHWETYARIVMRGSRIAAFRNGMNVTEVWGPLTEDMSMVERIEIVKGPAGFMLASGEPSGFYNVVTKKPTGISKAEVGMTVGSFGTYRTTADFDGKLSKDGKILYRLNVMGQMKGSHREFEYNNRVSIAPVIKYQINPNTSLTAEYTYQGVEMSPIGSAYAFSAKGISDLPYNFTMLEGNLKPTTIKDQSLFVTLSHSINANWKFTGQLAYLNYDQVGQSLWASGFSGDTLKRTTSIWDILGQTKVGQFFVNGDVETGALKHRILVGLDMGNKDYYHDWNQGGIIGDLNVYKPVYGQVSASKYPVFDRSLDIRERGIHYNNSYTALYAQDEIRVLNDKLRFTLAGRFTTTNDADPYSGTVKAEKFTPRVGLSYSVDKNTSVYAVYDEAFIPQAGGTFEGKKFDPIIGDNKEIGIKREWLNGRWNASVAAYKITKNNVLTEDPNHQYFSIQLGQTQTQGIEFDVRGQILPGLDLTMNYAVTDAKVTKDTDGSQVSRQVSGTDKYIFNTWLKYRFQSGAMEGLGISFGVQHSAGRSNWYGAYDKTVDATMPNYTRFDAAMSYQFGKFGVALNVNNLFNTYLITGGSYYTWSKYYYSQVEAMRNSRLSINYKF
ncbi:iron complex outermembrane receptor protein [Arcicella aurantiaca]|uniref:Iron complex outermembrane receptor protein n=1 Tax=Arcicella aurantiaca TaxID=591202 RepID=A0A316EB07_9BACT|nr:TonB-dependent receptor [Arcicella aurantiaca]PWK27625.1 iron complex outermembrane receptor protein [Arcicella aurantiaca]